MLMIDALSKRFDEMLALDSISAGLPNSGYAVILGESGSGKTTLLRTIAGHVQPDSGAISLQGENLVDLPAHRRPVAMVFQQYALFPHMTVAQNILFGLEQHRPKPANPKTRVSDLLDLVGLSGLEYRRPGTLSGGQQQRVALARALAVQPSVVLLDEPLGALDAELRQTMRHELARIQRESDVLFLHVSHDREEAWVLAQQLLILHAGRLVGDGTIDSLRMDPGNIHVARALGMDNIVSDPVQPGRKIAFAPEHVMIGDGQWLGYLMSTTPVGAMIENRFRLDTGELIRQRTMPQDTMESLRIGTYAGIVVNSAHIYTVDID